MVRQKTLECEKEHRAAVADLEAAGPLSANLHRYLDMTRFCHAGGMLWSAFTDRYNNSKVYQDTQSPLEDGSPKCDNDLDINRVRFRDGSSNNGIDPPMNGDHLQNGGPAVSGINGKGGGRPCLMDDLHESYRSDDAYEKPGTEIVLAPYEYVATMPSKKVREVLVDGLNRWLQLPEKSLNRIRNIVVMLHPAALMLDDIEDGSILRRGMPSAHVVYGESQTINSGSYVQIGAFAEAAGLSNPETGGLFHLILRLMQAESPVSKAFEPALETFITSLGRYFQVRNDHQNLASSEYAQQKGFCEDLDEGKMSLPLIHSLQNSSEGDKARIKGIFKTHGPSGLSPEVKEFVIKQLSERTASLQCIGNKLKDLTSELADGLMALEEIFWYREPMVEGCIG
ncbi:MAG: hypothetical protein Q9178_006000 [Gyalolechia marmorata]